MRIRFYPSPFREGHDGLINRKFSSHQGKDILNDTTGVSFPAVTNTVNGTDKGLLFVQRLQFTAQVFNVAVDGAVGYHAVIVIKMIE